MWALTAREMKECHLVTPRLVAQIEFTKWTPDGHLRYASFVGLRNDKEPLRMRNRWSSQKQIQHAPKAHIVLNTRPIRHCFLRPYLGSEVKK